MLHVDAHTDTYRGDGNQDHMRYNVATTFTRAAEEGLFDTNASLHIGPRGPTMDNSVFEHTREVGFQLIEGDDLFETGLFKTADNLVEQLKDRTVYLCFDMDFFNPFNLRKNPRPSRAVAPPHVGVQTPGAQDGSKKSISKHKYTVLSFS